MNEKEKINTMFREVFDRWEELLAGLNEEQITAANRIGELSIKDILAHLAAWQQVSLARMQAALQNQQPEYPGWPPELDTVHETNLDQTNAWIYQTYRSQAWPAIHKEWRERFLRILEIAQSIPENDFLETGRYSWLDEYPLSAVIKGSCEHHQEHLDSLLALLRQNGKL
jgi:hypothetical protein